VSVVVGLPPQVIHLDVDVSLAGDFEASASLLSRIMPFCPISVEISDLSVGPTQTRVDSYW